MILTGGAKLGVDPELLCGLSCKPYWSEGDSLWRGSRWLGGRRIDGAGALEDLGKLSVEGEQGLKFDDRLLGRQRPARRDRAGITS